MKKIKLGPNESHINVSIERMKYEKNNIGEWNITMYLSINNITEQNIRIININVDLYRLSDAPMLTIGYREGVDLTVKDSLIDSNKYYDIEPKNQETIFVTINLKRWDRIPKNITDGNCNIYFSMSIEYYTIYNNTFSLLKISVPKMLYFGYNKHISLSECKFLYIDKNNIQSLLDNNKNNSDIYSLLEDIKIILNEWEYTAYILSESDILVKEEEKKMHDINLYIIAENRNANIQLGYGNTISKFK